MSARRIALLILTAALVLPAAAFATTRHGITPTSPKPGATVPLTTTPTFKGKFHGRGVIYVHVCPSKKKDRYGRICFKADIGKAKKKSGHRFTYKPTFYDYPGFWLNTPGTYYWQAYRIACENGNLTDCYQEGPVVRFKVG